MQGKRRATVRRFGRFVPLAGLLLLFLSFLSPVSVASAQEPSCPDIKVFGLHGVNQPGPSEDTTETGGVGDQISAVWKKFAERSELGNRSVALEAVNFPRSNVSYDFRPSPPNALAADVARFLYDYKQLRGATDYAATQLIQQLYDSNTACGTKTRYLLVGYSQGAWAVDRALRAEPPLDLSPVDSQIMGVMLLGDPLFTVSTRSEKGILRYVPGDDHGVPDPYYLAKFNTRFLTVCANGNPPDPICMYDGNLVNLFNGIKTHLNAYVSGADILAGYLATFVGR